MEEENIWPEEEDFLKDYVKNSKFREVFTEEKRKFYIPSIRPKNISKEEWKKILKKNQKQRNNDLPIAISKQGEIVCLEKIRTAIRIQLVGISQFGKTTSLFAIADLMKWFWNCKIAFMNEGLGICFDHLYPTDTKIFKEKHELLKLKQRGLPLVFLYPSVENLELPNIQPELKITIPFEEFLKKPEDFCDLGKSGKYFAEIKKKIRKCKNIEDVKEVFESTDMPKPSKKSLISSINKMRINKIFDLDGEKHSELIITGRRKNFFSQTKKHPLISLLKVGLIPCLITSTLSDSEFEKQIYKYYLKLIWDEKQKKGILRNEDVVLFVDEINQAQENNKKILRKIIREGGNINLSMVFAGQNFTDIDKVIRSNTHIAIVFKQPQEEALAITKEFGLDSFYSKKIKNLKKFECLLVTKDKFIVYNAKNGKRYPTNEPILAQIIPPLSLHRKELSIDDYTKEKKDTRLLHERVLKKGNWNIFDIDGNSLFQKTEEVIKPKIKLNPLTITEDSNLKLDYFGEQVEETEEINYIDLERKGMRILSTNAKFTLGQETQIRVVYFLWPIKEPIPNSSHVLSSCPKSVTITYNNDKDGIQLFGVNTVSFENGELGKSDLYVFDDAEIQKYCKKTKEIVENY